MKPRKNSEAAGHCGFFIPIAKAEIIPTNPGK
jgi:hypothetical protein